MRTVRLVLTGGDRTVQGELPIFPVDTPWWADAEPVVCGARNRFGAELHVLRLLDVIGGEPELNRSGLVTYEAELTGDPPSFIDRTGPARPGPALRDLADNHFRGTAVLHVNG